MIDRSPQNRLFFASAALLACMVPGCTVARIICPAGVDLAAVSVDVMTDPIAVSVGSKINVCGLRFVVSVDSDSDGAEVCLTGPLVGRICDEVGE